MLTGAVRLGRPTSDAAGDERRAPIDRAEFVTLALAGAAANIGHVEAVLAARPGSWDAECVRQLLISTVSDDDQLLRHRTEPVEVDVDVDEILLDAGVWTAYEDGPTRPGVVGRCVRAGTAEQEREFGAIADLSERLEAQRQADWAAYGAANRVEAAAAKLENLMVPVVVHVDLDTFRSDAERARYSEFITPTDELVEETVNVTPLPGDGTDPLRRLQMPIERCPEQ